MKHIIKKHITLTQKPDGESDDINDAEEEEEEEKRKPYLLFTVFTVLWEKSECLQPGS